VPVTAHDFVFAWRRVVDPATAAPYAPLLGSVQHAEAIMAGKAAAASLGVEAVSDRELKVRFDRPCPWFAALAAYTTLLPQREDDLSNHGDRYAADVGRFLGNGPFRLTQWVHGASLTLQRNPNFRDRQHVYLERIEVPYITADPSARLNLFLDGQIALTPVAPEQSASVLQRRVRIRRFDDGSLNFLVFNFRAQRATQDRVLRRAIRAAIDPERIVNQVLRLPGALPADSLYPRFLSLDGVRLSEAAAFVTAGWSAPPAPALTEPLMLLVNDSPAAIKVAEYIQAQLGRRGIEVRLDRQIFKMRLQKMRSGEFDLALTNWGPDFDDPMTFADLLASWNPNNRGDFQHEEYDRLITRAAESTDPSTRLRAFLDMQRIVVDEVPVIPLYENAELYLQQPGIKGILRLPFGGDPVLRYARWVE